jgi:hypothetical protein
MRASPARFRREFQLTLSCVATTLPKLSSQANESGCPHISPCEHEETEGRYILLYLHPHQSDFCTLEVKLKFPTCYISSITTFASDAYAMDSLTSPSDYIPRLTSEAYPARCWDSGRFRVEPWFIGLSQSPGAACTGPAHYCSGRPSPTFARSPGTPTTTRRMTTTTATPSVIAIDYLVKSRIIIANSPHSAAWNNE